MHPDPSSSPPETNPSCTTRRGSSKLRYSASSGQSHSNSSASGQSYSDSSTSGQNHSDSSTSGQSSSSCSRAGTQTATFPECASAAASADRESGSSPAKESPGPSPTQSKSWSQEGEEEDQGSGAPVYYTGQEPVAAQTGAHDVLNIRAACHNFIQPLSSSPSSSSTLLKLSPSSGQESVAHMPYHNGSLSQQRLHGLHHPPHHPSDKSQWTLLLTEEARKTIN